MFFSERTLKNHLEYPKSTFDNQNWDISTFYLEMFYKHCFRKKKEYMEFTLVYSNCKPLKYF